MDSSSPPGYKECMQISTFGIQVRAGAGSWEKFSDAMRREESEARRDR